METYDSQVHLQYRNIHVYHIFLFVPSINLIFLLKILIIDEIEI